MDNAEKTKLIVHIRNKQRALNKKHEKEGLTEEILDEQIALNKLRHTYDIHDETEIVYEDYVQ